MTLRSRDRILANLDSIYRQAYERAKGAGDKQRMLELDWSYQREQLILEVLLDLRDALAGLSKTPRSKTALAKLDELRKLTRRR